MILVVRTNTRFTVYTHRYIIGKFDCIMYLNHYIGFSWYYSMYTYRCIILYVNLIVPCALIIRLDAGDIILCIHIVIL